MVGIEHFEFHKIYEVCQSWIGNHYWKLVEITLIILGCKVINILVGHLTKKLRKISHKSSVFWDEALVIAIEKPIKLAVWIIGLTFVLDVISYQARISLLKFVPVIRDVTFIMLVSWIVMRFINTYEAHALKKSKKSRNNKFIADLSIKITKIIVLFIAGLAILENCGFNISGLLALGGIGGAALAFASHSLLSNFFGAFIIYLDKPFVVGDYIFIKGEKVKGTVEEIGWRISVIRAFDQTPVYIQNAVFIKDSIINYSRITHKKISEVIGVTATNIGHTREAIDEIYQYLEKLDYVDKEFNIIVAVQDFGQDFLEITVQAVVAITDYQEYVMARQEVMLNVYQIFNRYGYRVIFSNDNKQLFVMRAPKES